MKKNTNWLKVIATLATAVLFVAACAPGELERIPVPGQEQPGGAELPSGGEAAPSGEMGANIDLPPTQPVCPTPTPTTGVGTTGGGESGVGEAVTGPAITEEVGGQTIVGTVVPDILDKVNQAPDLGRSDQTSGETGVGPEPGTETQPGDVSGATNPTGSTEPTFGDLLDSVIGQVLGTSEPGEVSFDPPPPSPTPCP